MGVPHMIHKANEMGLNHDKADNRRIRRAAVLSDAGARRED
jgi:hypothetical protein